MQDEKGFFHLSNAIKDLDSKLDDKLESIDSRLNSIDVTLVKQNITLEDHTRRSLANEKAVEILRDELKPVFSNNIIISFLGKLSLLTLSSGLLWELIKYVTKD